MITNFLIWDPGSSAHALLHQNNNTYTNANPDPNINQHRTYNPNALSISTVDHTRRPTNTGRITLTLYLLAL